MSESKTTKSVDKSITYQSDGMIARAYDNEPNGGVAVNFCVEANKDDTDSYWFVLSGRQARKLKMSLDMAIEESENREEGSDEKSKTRYAAVWIENADSYICSHCRKETGYAVSVCPNYGALMLGADGTTKAEKGKIERLLQLLQDTCFDIRASHGDDSVCGLCEYDSPMSEAGSGMDGGDCPGFDSDECFRLKQEIINEYYPDAKIKF